MMLRKTIALTVVIIVMSVLLISITSSEDVKKDKELISRSYNTESYKLPDGTTETHFYSGIKYIPDEKGVFEEFTNVVNFTQASDGFYLTYYDKKLKIEPYIIWNKEKIKVSEATKQQATIQPTFMLNKYATKYSYGMNLSLPTLVASSSDAVGFEITEINFPEKEIKVNAHSLELPDHILLDFGDLSEKGMNLTFANSTDIMISNVSSAIDLDPTIIYNFTANDYIEAMSTADCGSAAGNTGFPPEDGDGPIPHCSASGVWTTNLTTSALLDAADNSYAFRSISGGDFSYFLFYGISTIDPTTIVRMNWSIVARGSNVAINQVHFLWNNTGKTWNECGNNATNATWRTINCTVDTSSNANITNFFNDTGAGASDGFYRNYFLVAGENPSGTQYSLYVDYVELTILTTNTTPVVSDIQFYNGSYTDTSNTNLTKIYRGQRLDVRNIASLSPANSSFKNVQAWYQWANSTWVNATNISYLVDTYWNYSIFIPNNDSVLGYMNFTFNITSEEGLTGRREEYHSVEVLNNNPTLSSISNQLVTVGKDLYLDLSGYMTDTEDSASQMTTEFVINTSAYGTLVLSNSTSNLSFSSNLLQGAVNVQLTTFDSDWGSSSTQSFDIRIQNQAPSIYDIQYYNGSYTDISNTNLTDVYRGQRLDIRIRASDNDGNSTISRPELWYQLANNTWNNYTGVISYLTDTYWNASINIPNNDSYLGFMNFTVNITDSNSYTKRSEYGAVEILNNNPTLSAISTQNINEDNDLSLLLQPYVTDTEDQLSSITYKYTNNNTGLITVSIANSTGNLSANPGNNLYGAATITVTAYDSDWGYSSTQTFEIIIASVNDNPVVYDIQPYNSSYYDTLNMNYTKLYRGQRLDIRNLISDVDGNTTIIDVESWYQWANSSWVNVTSLMSTVTNTYYNYSVIIPNNDSVLGYMNFTTNVTDSSGAHGRREEYGSVEVLNNVPTLSALPTLNTNEDYDVSFLLQPYVTDVEDPLSQITYTYTNNNTGLITVAIDNSTGNLSAIPGANLFGSASITVTAYDTEWAATSTQTFLINISSINDAPVIYDIQPYNSSYYDTLNMNYTKVYRGQRLDIRVVGSDIEGNSTIKRPELWYDIPNSTWTNYTGVMSYVTNTYWNASWTIPNNDSYLGFMNFTVNITDGSNWTRREEYQTVEILNNNPTLSAISTQNINEDYDLYLNLQSYVTDVEDSLSLVTYQYTNNNTGMLTVTIDNSTGNLSANPTNNSFGSASITVTVYDSDGGSSSTQTFLINISSINDAPIISDIQYYNGSYTDTLNTNLTDVYRGGRLDIRAIASDIEGNSTIQDVELWYQLANSTWNNYTGVISYVTNTYWNASITIPNNDSYLGFMNFTVNVTDGTNFTKRSEYGSVEILNNNPTLSSISTMNMTEDYDYSFSLQDHVTDVEDQLSSITYTYTNNNTGLVTVTIANSTGNFTAVPAANSFGSASITVTAYDSDWGSSSTQTFLLNISSINDAPVIYDIQYYNGSYTDTLNTNYTKIYRGNRIDFRVVASDTDGNSTVLMPNITYQLPNLTWTTYLGTVSYVANTYWNGSFIIPNNDSFLGYLNFTVNLTDGTNWTRREEYGVMEILNNPPTLSALPNLSVGIGKDLYIDLNTYRADVEDQANNLFVQYRVNGSLGTLTIDNTTGNMSFAAGTDQGAVRIQLEVYDTEGANTTASFKNFEIAIQNQVPNIYDIQFYNGSYTDTANTAITKVYRGQRLDIRMVAFDNDGNSTIEDVEAWYQLANSTWINYTGLLSYITDTYWNYSITIPNNDSYLGYMNFTFNITDGNVFNKSTENQQVEILNNNPVLVAIPTQNINEDYDLSFWIDSWRSDIEDLNNQLTIEYTNNNTGLLTVTIDNSTGNLSANPANNSFGAATITAQVFDTDWGYSTLRTFEIIVASINDAPVISDIQYYNGSYLDTLNTNYTKVYRGQNLNVYIVASDVDGNATIKRPEVWYQLPNNTWNNYTGTISYNTSNYWNFSLTFPNNDSYLGYMNFTVNITDGTNYTRREEYGSVEGVNNNPTLSALSGGSTEENSYYYLDLSGYRSDVEDLQNQLTIKYTLNSTRFGTLLIDNSTGNLTFYASGSLGGVNVQLTAYDTDLGASSAQSFDIRFTDTLKPYIGIDYPTNTTYRDVYNMSLNFSFYDYNNASAYKYTLNNGVTNTTITGNTTLSLLAGSYNVRVYANDTQGNENVSSVSFYSSFTPRINNVNTSNTTTSFTRNDLNTGLVGYWKFDKNWTIQEDSSGFGNNASVTNATFTPIGAMGGAYSFNRVTSSKITVPYSSNYYNFTCGNISISYWINPVESIGIGDPGIISRSSSTTRNFNSIYNVSGKYVTFRTFNSSSDHTLSSNKLSEHYIWHQVTLTYNRTTKQIWIDGALDVENAWTGCLKEDNSNIDIGFATNNGFFNGSIDELRIYNRSLDASDIYKIYSLTNPNFQEYANVTLTVNVTDEDSSSLWYSWFVDSVMRLSGYAQNIFNYIFTKPSQQVRVAVNDSFGYSVNQTWNITTNFIIPTVNIVSPSNNTNTTNTQLEIDYVYIEVNPFNCYWSKNAGITNNSLASCGTNITGQTWSEGINNITVYVNDTVGNVNSTTITFRLDTTRPNTTIIYSPENITYLDLYSRNLSLQVYTLDSGVGVSSYWYNLNNAVTNTTFTPNTTIAGLNITNNILKVYTNDTLGNENVTTVNFYLAFTPKVNLINTSNLTTNYYTNQLTTGLVGWWKLDQNSTTQIDSSGMGNNATVIGAKFNYQGVLGGSYTFNGTNTTYLTVNKNAVNNLSNFTFVAFFKTPDIINRYIFSCARTDVLSNHILIGGYTTNSSVLTFYVNDSLYKTADIFPMDDNKWHQLVITRNGTLATYYIDGVIRDSNTVNSGILNVSDGGFIIGQDQDTIGGTFDSLQSWNGSLDELRIYNRSLSPLEVYQLYSIAKPNFQEYPNVTIIANITDEDTTSSNLWYEWFVDNVRRLSGYAQNIFNYIFTGRSQIITLAVNDTNNYTVTQYWNISTNYVIPVVNIVSPVNGTNTTNSSLEVSYTYTEANIFNCYWTKNRGITNTSITCGTNITSTWSEGINNVTIYLNDTVSNINYSTVTFRLDTTRPNTTTIYSPENITYLDLYSRNLSLQVYTLDSGVGVSSYWYSMNNGRANVTFTPNSSIAGLAIGDNNLTVYTNDTLGNENVTSVAFYLAYTPKVNLINTSNITTSYSNSNLSNGLVAYWKFDKNSTNQENSVSGLYNLTAQNSTAFTSNGKISGAYTYNGVDQNMISDANYAINTSQSGYTISAWMYRLPDGHSWTSVAGINFANIGSGIGIDTLSTNQVGAWACGNSGTAVTISGSLINKWSHVVAVYSQNVSNFTQARIYYDGVYAGNSVTDRYLPCAINSTFQVASSYYGYSTSFNGTIDEFRFYNRSLSDLEVYQLYSITNPSFQEYPNVTITANITDEDTASGSLWYNWFVDNVIRWSGYAQNVFNYIFTRPSQTVTLAVNDTRNYTVTQSWNVSQVFVIPVIDYTTLTPGNNSNLTINNFFVNFTVTDANYNMSWITMNGVNYTSTCVGSYTCGYNFTSLSDGSYNFTAYADDKVGNINKTLTRYVTIDTTYPSLIIASPVNSSNYSTKSVTVNYTYSDTNLLNCWYYNDSVDINVSLTCGINITNNYADGLHTVIVYTNDSAGNTNSTKVSFWVDTVMPNVTINSPLNTTYRDLYNKTLELNLTVSDNSSISSYKYTIDNGVTNNTFYSNATMVTLTPGNVNLKIYVTDLVGNENYTSKQLYLAYTPKINEINVSNASNSYTRNNYSLQQGLVGYWNFDENWTIAIDKSGYGNNGTVTGATWNTSGKISGAYTFDGVNDQVVIPTYTAINFGTSSAYSVNFWFIGLNKTFNDVSLTEKWSPSTGGYQWAIRLSDVTNTITFGIYNGSSKGNPSIGSIDTTPLNDGKWHMVTAVNNGTTLFLYLDSSSNGSTYYGVLPGNLGTNNVAIGSRGGSKYFNGTIDEYRIYNRSLSTADVRNLYYTTNPNFQESANATINVSITDEDSSNLYYRWKVNNVDLYSGYNKTQFNYNYNSTTQNITLEVNDSFNYLVTQFWTLNTTYAAPVITISNPINTTYRDLYYKNLSLTFTVADESNLSTYKYTIDNGVTNTSFVPNSTIVTGLTNGSTNIYLYVTDALGNEGVNSTSFYLGFTPKLNSTNITNSTTNFYTEQLTTGLVGWWKLDENNTNQIDSSGANQNLTVINATAIEGKLGGGYKFNSQSVAIVKNYIKNSTNLSDGFTLSAWVKPAHRIQGYTDTGIIGCTNYTSPYPRGPFLLTIVNESGGLTSFGGYADPGTGQIWTTAAINYTNDQWYFMTLTFNNSDLILYKDGVYFNNTESSFFRVTSNLTDMMVGARGYSDTGYIWRGFNGTIDDARIYNRSLSAAEVNQLYSITNSQYPVDSNISIKVTTKDEDTAESSLWYEWFVDGARTAYGYAQNFFSWIFNKKSTVVTVVVNDSLGYNVTQSWNVTTFLELPSISDIQYANYTYSDTANTNITRLYRTERLDVRAVINDNNGNGSIMNVEFWYQMPNSTWVNYTGLISNTTDVYWNYSLIIPRDWTLGFMNFTVNATDGRNWTRRAEYQTVEILNNISTMPVHLLQNQTLFQINNTDSVNINWSNASDSDSDLTYIFELSNTSEFLNFSQINMSIQPGSNITGINVSFDIESTYYYRILATDNIVNTSYTPVQQFNITFSEIPITLNSPVNYYNNTNQSQIFNFTATTSDIDSCSLYGNWSGSWAINQTIRVTSGVMYNFTNINLADGFYLWNVRCNRTLGHSSESPINYTISVSTIGPFINIIEPTNDRYANTSVSLLYTRIPNVNAIDQCWWNYDNNYTNVTLTTSCINTTITLTNGEHQIRLYANDSLNIESYDTINYTIDTSLPSVILNNPTNWTWFRSLTNITFNFTVTHIDGIESCSLWINQSGSFISTITNTSAVKSGFIYNTSLVLEDQHQYIWNVNCSTGLGQSGFALKNHTIGLDNINPNIAMITSPGNSTTSTVNCRDVISFNFSVTDNFLSRCWFSVNHSSLGLDLDNTSVNCRNLTYSFTPTRCTTLEDYFTILVYANDSAGNENYTSHSFKYEYSAGGGGSGGPGGGGGSQEPTIITQTFSLLASGSACTDDMNCSSNFCRDGFCSKDRCGNKVCDSDESPLSCQSDCGLLASLKSGSLWQQSWFVRLLVLGLLPLILIILLLPKDTAKKVKNWFEGED